MSRSKVIMCDTPSHASDPLCLIWKESIQNCWRCRADTACGTDIFQQFYCKIMPEWPWRYRSRSKVIVRDTPSHASDHLCLIWKEYIQNCRRYRADMACGTDRRTDGRTDRRTDGVKPIYPPTTSLYNYSQVNATEHLWRYVHSVSHNGLVPRGNTPLP